MSNTREESLQEFARKITPDRIGFILSIAPLRIGSLAFISFLEHRHFCPVPEVNDDFQMCLVDWQEMKWAIVAIPRTKEAAAREIMAELGLRAANGVPHCISHEGHSHFPIDQPNVFTLENIPGHFAYRNDPALEKTAYDFELEAVHAQEAKSMEKLAQWRKEHAA